VLPSLAIDGAEPVRSDPFPESAIFGADDKEAVDRLFAHAIETGQRFNYNGAEQKGYEADFADYHGGGYALLLSSGTAPPYVALASVVSRRPAEVIVPAITDAGGIMPVPLLNMESAVADVELGSFNVGPQQIEARLSGRSAAIVVAHIGGEPAEMCAITELARCHDIPVVEDCSQAHGAAYQRELVGTFGDVAVFSTNSGKHHCTGAQGGVVFTRDPDICARARMLRDRGKAKNPERAEYLLAALNLSGNDLAGAIGRTQLKKLPDRLARRRQRVAELIAGTRDLAATHVIAPMPDCEPAYWFARVRIDLAGLGITKDRYLAALRAEGIPCPMWADIPAEEPWFSVAWPVPPRFRSAGSRRYGTGPISRLRCGPNAREAINDHLTLFVHQGWTTCEIHDTCLALRKLEHALLEAGSGRLGAGGAR
jgi:perosamine synthetase